jgi:hypothetical protein
MAYPDTQDKDKQSNSFASGLSLRLKEEHKLQVVENNLLRRKLFDHRYKTQIGSLEYYATR